MRGVVRNVAAAGGVGGSSTAGKVPNPKPVRAVCPQVQREEDMAGQEVWGAMPAARELEKE